MLVLYRSWVDVCTPIHTFGSWYLGIRRCCVAQINWATTYCLVFSARLWRGEWDQLVGFASLCRQVIHTCVPSRFVRLSCRTWTRKDRCHQEKLESAQSFERFRWPLSPNIIVSIDKQYPEVAFSIHHKVHALSANMEGINKSTGHAGCILHSNDKRQLNPSWSSITLGQHFIWGCHATWKMSLDWTLKPQLPSTVWDN